MNMKPVLGSQIQLGHPLARGLVGCWLFNEGSGNIVHDASGNGGDGTATSYVWRSGSDGREIAEVASGSEFGIDTPVGYYPLNNAAACTVHMTVTPDSILDDGGLFYTNEHALTANSAVCLWLDNSTSDHVAVIVYGSGGNTGVDYSAYVPVAGTTFTVTLTWNGTTTRLYINGIEDTAGDFPGTGATGTLDGDASVYHFGNDTGGGKELDGGIRNAALWTRALTAQEVASLYADPYGMFRSRHLPLWVGATSVGGAPPAATGYMTLNTGFWGP